MYDILVGAAGAQFGMVRIDMTSIWNYLTTEH